ncbi:MAG: RNA polymerase sigma factor [Acidimicrobiia bacterium]|nr:RNA polymerase sigma factor [Acidimicrobiia bacterium]
MLEPDLQRLFGEMNQQLVRLAASIVGPDDAADVVAATFARQSERGMAAVENHRAYLFRAVANESISHQRSVRRRLARNARFLRLNQRPSPTVSTRDFDVERALDRLSPQQRLIVHLTYWEDHTSGSIASLLGVSEGSIKKQLARARKTLREELGYGNA